ncbi:hypothetical protein [Halococcus sp. PRR34]|uniref:hypothetical protein n=1 Tax=Halococcus sp. PRR34 TaxID=3020830 RepID=UPI00235FD7EA|nr:hypothetical protein [Halococcus sp. PRR34]
MTAADTVLNAETQRALRRRVRQLKMVAVGGLVAIVLFGAAGLSATSSVPWQLSVVVTVVVAVALPVAVPYAMLRVYGLAHRDVLYVAKRAYREVAAEIIALSGTSTVSVAFGESGTDTDETADSVSHSPVEAGPDDTTTGFESGESADGSSIAHETSQTEPTPTETNS